LRCIKQGGDDVKFLSSESRIVHRNPDLSQDQFFRKVRPLVYRIRQIGVIDRAFP
jgi:hypothetical protein